MKVPNRRKKKTFTVNMVFGFLLIQSKRFSFNKHFDIDSRNSLGKRRKENWVDGHKKSQMKIKFIQCPTKKKKKENCSQTVLLKNMVWMQKMNNYFFLLVFIYLSGWAYHIPRTYLLWTIFKPIRLLKPMTKHSKKLQSSFLLSSNNFKIIWNFEM